MFFFFILFFTFFQVFFFFLFCFLCRVVPLKNKKVKQAEEPRQSLAKFCIKCGLQHVDGAIFCMECGHRRVKKPSQPSAPTNVRPESPQPQPQPTSTPTTSQAQVIDLVSSATKKRNKGKGGGSRTKKKDFCDADGRLMLMTATSHQTVEGLAGATKQQSITTVTFLNWNPQERMLGKCIPMRQEHTRTGLHRTKLN